jgi:hypothetical protein
MNEWISVKDRIPNPFEVVWIYWRDREVLLGCRTYVDVEAIKCEPSEGWYSFEDEKCRWTNYWQPINAMSLDKPSKPDISK